MKSIWYVEQKNQGIDWDSLSMETIHHYVFKRRPTTTNCRKLIMRFQKKRLKLYHQLFIYTINQYDSMNQLTINQLTINQYDFMIHYHESISNNFYIPRRKPFIAFYGILIMRQTISYAKNVIIHQFLFWSLSIIVF